MPSDTMRAIVLDKPGSVANLQLRSLPIPRPELGWVRIKVKAFGLNRSELLTRLGHSGDAVTYPRVLGIEAVGVIDYDPAGKLEPGQQVMTMMGGMGRKFDGGYAEYTCVPANQVITFQSDLEWSVLGAIPEMLQTSYGSLTVGLSAQPGESILIRGGTSSVGMAAAIIAQRLGMAVVATTRSPNKSEALTHIGVDHTIIDTGEVADQVRLLFPDGVDKALELVGTPTLYDTLRATKVHGIVCFTGMLSGQWTIPDFYPIDYIPRGVCLTAYSGEAGNLPPAVLYDFLTDISAGKITIPIDQVYSMEQIQQAHSHMESGQAKGKLVVIV